MVSFKQQWSATVNKMTSTSHTKGGNKLRTYKQFKTEYETEAYVTLHTLTRGQRSALAKFRCGVAPLRIETGRFEGLARADRRCFSCTDRIESERHALLSCKMYDHIRKDLFDKISQYVVDFHSLSKSDKLCHILSNTSVVKYSAKACQDILLCRRANLYDH